MKEHNQYNISENKCLSIVIFWSFHSFWRCSTTLSCIAGFGTLVFLSAGSSFPSFWSACAFVTFRVYGYISTPFLGISLSPFDHVLQDVSLKPLYCFPLDSLSTESRVPQPFRVCLSLLFVQQTIICF
jgi:hypothetical protein